MSRRKLCKSNNWEKKRGYNGENEFHCTLEIHSFAERVNVRIFFILYQKLVIQVEGEADRDQFYMDLEIDVKIQER